jgi:HlyD family secretion protein
VADQTVTMRRVGSDAPITGRVRLVEPAIDTTTRLGRARIWIEPGSPVVQGMFLDGEVLVAERETVAVPVTAISSSPDGAVVMRVVEGTAEKVVVRTGIRDGGWIEVTEGLAAGDTVVLKAGAFVRDGDRINPVPAATN